MGRHLEIEPAVLLFAALALYLLPLPWLFGALLAAAVHEGAHLLALRLLRVPVQGLSLGVFGAKIEAGPMETIQELLCALAGPLGSGAMVLLCPVFPEAALCGLVQGAFNLLPLYPMDGGRVLRCLLPEWLCCWIERIILLMILGLTVWAVWGLNLGAGACFPGLALMAGCRQRKIPCK